DNGDNLLFRAEDFDKPCSSAIFQALWELKDPVARSLVGHLILATQMPLDSVPLLHDLANGGAVAPLTVVQEKQVDTLLAEGASRVRQTARAGVRAATAAPVTTPAPSTVCKSLGTETTLSPSPIPSPQPLSPVAGKRGWGEGATQEQAA